MDITPEKKVTTTLRAVIALIGVVITCSWWLSNKVGAIDKSLTEMSNRIVLLEDGRFSKAEAAEQAYRMAIENPGLRVPDPRNPAQIIIVQAATIRPKVEP